MRVKRSELRMEFTSSAAVGLLRLLYNSVTFLIVQQTLTICLCSAMPIYRGQFYAENEAPQQTNWDSNVGPSSNPQFVSNTSNQKAVIGQIDSLIRTFDLGEKSNETTFESNNVSSIPNRTNNQCGGNVTANCRGVINPSPLQWNHVEFGAYLSVIIILSGLVLLTATFVLFQLFMKAAAHVKNDINGVILFGEKFPLSGSGLYKVDSAEFQ